MTRAKSNPRRSHRQRRGSRVTVADVVRAAVPQSAVPAARPVAAVDPDDELTTIVISTGPAVTYRIPDPPRHAAAPRAEHPLGTPAPLAPGHAHADVVLAELLAVAAEVEHPAVPAPAAEAVPDPRAIVRGLHVTAAEIVLDAVLDLTAVVAVAADELTLALVEFACALSDLAVAPGGRYAVRRLVMPSLGEDLSAWDRRTRIATVGRELNSAVAA